MNTEFDKITFKLLFAKRGIICQKRCLFFQFCCILRKLILKAISLKSLSSVKVALGRTLSESYMFPQDSNLAPHKTTLRDLRQRVLDTCKLRSLVQNYYFDSWKLEEATII